MQKQEFTDKWDIKNWSILDDTLLHCSVKQVAEEEKSGVKIQAAKLKNETTTTAKTKTQISAFVQIGFLVRISPLVVVAPAGGSLSPYNLLSSSMWSTRPEFLFSQPIRIR